MNHIFFPPFVHRLNSEKLFFLCGDFFSPNILSDSVSDAKSHDIQILTEFPGKPILEILIKICNCVGGTNMRRCFLVKLCLIAILIVR